MIEKTAKSIFNLPNIITMARILAVPFLLWSLFAIGDKSSGWRWLSVIIFVVIMASDGIDGAIARKRGLVTNLGKLLDPIADSFRQIPEPNWLLKDPLSLQYRQ